MGAIKNFRDPNSEDRRKAKELAADLRPPPVFEAIEAARALELLTLTKSVVKNAEALLTFVDSRRDLARRAAVETIAIEISVIMTSDRLDRVIDALEHAIVADRPAQISLDGLRTLRRMEALLAEASSNMARFAQEGMSALGDHEARVSDDARRRAAIIEIEERRLALVKEEHRLSEQSMDRDLERRRADMNLVASLGAAPTSTPFWGALPLAASSNLNPIAIAPAPETSSLDSFWQILAIGALTFSAGLALAFLLRPAEQASPEHPRPRRK